MRPLQAQSTAAALASFQFLHHAGLCVASGSSHKPSCPPAALPQPQHSSFGSVLKRHPIQKHFLPTKLEHSSLELYYIILFYFLHRLCHQKKKLSSMFMEILFYSPHLLFHSTNLHVNSMKARMVSVLFDAPAPFFHGEVKCTIWLSPCPQLPDPKDLQVHREPVKLRKRTLRRRKEVAQKAGTEPGKEKRPESKRQVSFPRPHGA